MDDESTPTAAEVEAGAPGADEAAPESGAPAEIPAGYIEESRYANLRQEFNRKQAVWDRAQQGDLEAMRELQLPIQYPEEDDGEDLGDDPYAALERRQAALEQWAQQQNAQQQETGQTQRFELITEHIGALAEEKDWELGELERNALALAAVAAAENDVMKVESSDVVALFNKAHAVEEERLQRRYDQYVQSKRNAPRVSPGGTGATERPYRDDMSLDERVAAAQEQARLASEQ